VSVKPGTIVICFASRVRVLFVASDLMSALLPTAMIRPPLTANASARASDGSIV